MRLRPCASALRAGFEGDVPQPIAQGTEIVQQYRLGPPLKITKDGQSPLTDIPPAALSLKPR